VDGLCDLRKNMEWSLPTQTTSSRKRANESVQPIDQLVRASRLRVHAEADKLPQMMEKLQALSLRLEAMEDSRWNLRRRRDLQVVIDAEKEKIESIKRGDHIAKFEESVAHFIRAYNTNEQQQRKKVASVAVLPGERPQTFRVENTNSRQAEVVSEYLTEIDNQIPRILMTRADVCPKCDVPMRLVPAKAVITCIQCGYCCSYLDATTSSVSFGDDIEFTNFSYKSTPRDTQHALPHLSQHVLPFCRTSSLTPRRLRASQESTISANGWPMCRASSRTKFLRKCSTKSVQSCGSRG
tara:strand:+ start:1657 stop:2544 length:888 start_codon:yes stop_codon:yes gene_type:complete